MTPAERRERYASLAWLTDPDAWAPVDAALWRRCAGHMLPAERDRMNHEIRQYLRAHGADHAPKSHAPAALTVFGEPIESLLADFIGVCCSVCDHEIVPHTTKTAGCSVRHCNCFRRPGTFR